MVFPLSDVVAPSNDTVKLRQSGINFYAGNDHLGSGDLYIGENEFSWIRSDGHGISLDYPSISLHAISKDESSFVHPCLYLMVHYQSNGNGIDNAETGSQDGEEESEDGVVEMRFVPEDSSTLEEMFKIVSTCQALHPDPADSMSDSENGDNLFANLCENFNPPLQACAGGDGNDNDNDDDDESPFHMEAGPGEYEDDGEG